MRWISMLAVAVSLLTPITVMAETDKAPCAAAEYHQFDFWLGNWEVRNPDGEVVGTNRVTRILDGCAIMEHWQGAKGPPGQSVNMYDVRRHVWHQTWVSEAGYMLLLEGGLRDKAMVLEGKRPTRDGKGDIIDRITWTPNADGTVRQFWQISKDGGKSWEAAFDGLYVPEKE